MIKKAVIGIIGDYLSEGIKIVVGCSYSVALLFGTVFIILWILGWKKGIKGAVWTLAAFAIINIFGGIV
jgi:hypothetical protein